MKISLVIKREEGWKKIIICEVRDWDWVDNLKMGKGG